VITDRYRLRGMLQCHKRDRLLLQVTPPVAQGMLAQRQAELVKKRGKLAYDTAFGELCVVRAFFAWCIKKGWLARDPFAEVELEGQKVNGKPQLYIDESRRFVEAALAENSPEGLAAAMAILMGMRASEITNRIVREVDDGGRVLWISRAKTPKGNRHLKVRRCCSLGCSSCARAANQTSAYSARGGIGTGSTTTCSGSAGSPRCRPCAPRGCARPTSAALAQADRAIASQGGSSAASSSAPT